MPCNEVARLVDRAFRSGLSEYNTIVNEDGKLVGHGCDNRSVQRI